MVIGKNTLKGKSILKTAPPLPAVKGEPVASGMVASIGKPPFIVIGTVRILKSAKEGYKVRDGDIIVTEQTNPDYVVYMKKASAIVTETGGIASHAAIVSRELGIPCIVSVRGAMKKLRDGERYVIDVRRGLIFKARGGE